MRQQNFSDAALVLIGHGTTLNPGSAAPVFQHAADLRRRKLFAEVREGFWKQPPLLLETISEVRATRVYIAPFLMSEGYFCEQVIPKALGFQVSEVTGWERLQQRGLQTLVYCKPVGTHPSITNVVLGRAREVLEQFPFPRAPRPDTVSLFIAGHGTDRDENSREAVERQVELIRALNEFADVKAVYLEEEPRISACYTMARTRNVVIVPFFMSGGLHVAEDIPILLGEPARTVSQRLANGQSPWRNPTEKVGKLVWYTPAIGSDARMTDVVLERVRESSGW